MQGSSQAQTQRSGVSARGNGNSAGLIASQFIMTLLAIAVTAVAMLAGNVHGFPQAYLDRREAFLQEELSMRLGSDLVSNCTFT